MGWLFYTVVVVCCFSVRAVKASTQEELNDLNEKLEKVEFNSTDDRLERIEVLVKAHFKDFRPIDIITDAQVPKVHTDCHAAYEAGWVKSGMYRISPDGEHEMDVLCEQEEHGGGWTVLQQRHGGKVNFHRSWDEYKKGFGKLDGEFWIGNQNINVLTENRKQTLRVELQYKREGFFHVDYRQFWVGAKSSKFKLHLSWFSGEDDIAGDSLSYHNEQAFSTKNMDNDNDYTSCANVHRGGWWYDNCTKANLNGVYDGQSHSGIFWQSWRGFSNSLISVRMMVRGEALQLLSNKVYQDCQDAYTRGQTTSGVYKISPDGISEVLVYCEQELLNGGWTVFQRRKDGSQDFYLYWDDYKHGFGDAAGEYWLGNEYLHQLTANQDTQLLVELQVGDVTGYARYADFWIGDMTSNFQLYVNGFSTSPNGPSNALDWHKGFPFTTRDRDNDRYAGNCAQYTSGAWWYNHCSMSNLNGVYNKTIGWFGWGSSTSLSAVRMMVKTK